MNLDFRTKFCMTVVIATTLISGYIPSHYPLLAGLVASLPFILLLIEGRFGIAFKGLGLIGLALLSSRALVGSRTGPLGTVFLVISGIALHMLPGIMMGYYSLVTTKISDLIGSLKKLGLPDSLVIPISVSFRFFYSTREDYGHISDSMKIIGLDYRTFFKDPMTYLEYKVVPLLMCAVNAADDVAISAVARGMRVGQVRSTISDTRLGILDYIFLALMVALMIFYIYLRLIVNA